MFPNSGIYLKRSAWPAAYMSHCFSVTLKLGDSWQFANNGSWKRGPEDFTSFLRQGKTQGHRVVSRVAGTLALHTALLHTHLSVSYLFLSCSPGAFLFHHTPARGPLSTLLNTLLSFLHFLTTAHTGLPVFLVHVFC